LNLQLSSNHRIGIIGGGPAGSFTALHLHQMAREMELELDVLIFEPREFEKPGPAGCNRCAGILSSRVISGLESLGVTLPEDIIQSEIDSLNLHLDGEMIRIRQPDPARRIVSVYRGGGPRLHQGAALSSFDGYLLEQACSRGSRHISQRVRHVIWDGKPVIQTSREEYQVDFLVLATGINSRAPLSHQFGYRPPSTALMAQEEIPRPGNWPNDQVNAYFNSPPGLIFGAIIPKNDYLNISLLGKDLTRDAINDFVITQDLKHDLEYDEGSSLCGCNPLIAIGPAQSYYGDRWVAVGDTAVTRLYKDGIGSAFYSAQSAMQAALKIGISKAVFKKHYAPYCQRMSWDNRYGNLLYRMWNITLNTPSLMQALVRTLRAELDSPREKQLHIRIVWGMFTGDESYRALFRLWLQPKAIRQLLFPPNTENG
jgi:flavin-dependent dehydrogenase